jgi:phosphate starvation-inducible PhoH-like protein
MALRDKDMKPVIAYGSAGTGKTYGAVAAAYELLVNKKVGRIVVTRPNVPFADTNGFLPGTAREKIDPWVKPIMQHLGVFCNPNVIESWEKNGKLQFHLLEHVQGLTFDNSFVILDECQNMTFQQLKVFLTRTGKYSKVVLCGDIAQTSPRFKNSGLAELLRMVEKYELPVHYVEFGPEDILRSAQCKQWIMAFDKWESENDKVR